ncbi:MAG: type II toxin-antitoxin system PemK/MazF family toxin [Defluviitaleaceae bacterium]|nr:type II toxin-antitoxin system PemK/MazF family toxin [Defluviitaleaceae bacterium]
MTYTPAQGDIIILNFDPQAGHEQKGRRPALVVSNVEFHKRTNLAMVCPITNTLSGFPTHVTLDHRTRTRGEIMCEQVKCLDPAARNAVFAESVSDYILDEVTDIICAFVE